MIGNCFVCHERHRESSLLPIAGRHVCKGCYGLIHKLFHVKAKCGIGDIISIAEATNFRETLDKMVKKCERI